MKKLAETTPQKNIAVLAFHDNHEAEMQVVARVLTKKADQASYTVKAAAKDEDLFWSLKNEKLPDIVLINLDGDDLHRERIFSIIKEARRLYPKGVIITGAYDDDAQAIVKSLECGADDYISKQVRLRNFPRDLYNIYNRTIERNQKFRHEISLDHVVVGATMEKIHASIPHILDSAIATVFLYGESGTGKEAVADLFRLHLKKDTPFIKVNCGAISPSLMEAEFFGYLKGAFTGAIADKKGLIEKASGGWLFLDEVTALSLTAQAALLRAIENGEIIRVGGNLPTKVHVKYIAATNENISKLVSEGKFRLDLWQRLTNKTIVLKTLRERQDEIEAIIRHHCQTMLGGPYAITDPTISILAKLPWKEGNIRQLRNCLRAMTECHADKVLTPTTIPKDIRDTLTGDKPNTKKDTTKNLQLSFDSADSLVYDDLVDQLLIKLILKVTRTNAVPSLRKLAAELGMVRTTLGNRLKAIAKKPLAKEKEVQSILARFLS